jgi:glucan phosphoethanolaminetransferase (alkaline phosphatase superfamily)
MARAVVALILLVAAAAVLVFAAAPVSSRVVTFGISIGGNSAARVVFHTDIERALRYTGSTVSLLICANFEMRVTRLLRVP